MLCLGVGAAIANLDVRYDANGLQVRTGWSTVVEAPAVQPGQPIAGTGQGAPGNIAAPWRAELTALEQRLRADLRQPPGPVNPGSPGSNIANGAAPANPTTVTSNDTLRRVRALVDESERRQQRELALRLAEAIRDIERAAAGRSRENRPQHRRDAEQYRPRDAETAQRDAELRLAPHGVAETAVREDDREEDCIGRRWRRHHQRGRGVRPDEQSAADQKQKQARYEIAQMERVLEGAVEHGVANIRDRLQALGPTELLISDNARARGFRLDGYGVFFDVVVPSLDTTVLWSIRTLDQNLLGLQSALKELETHVKQSGDVNLEQALRRIELQVDPLLVARSATSGDVSAATPVGSGARNVNGSVAAATADVPAAGRGSDPCQSERGLSG